MKKIRCQMKQKFNKLEAKIRMPRTCQVPAHAKSGRVSNRAVKYAFLLVQNKIGGNNFSRFFHVLDVFFLKNFVLS